ncbi:MAG: GNAT family N-acetyltransferase [Candidatus Nanoarchaeia archaeon]|nr:GNAT family N-acetyltransferase [Candidatus Nanoarchaeia archaeon]
MTKLEFKELNLENFDSYVDYIIHSEELYPTQIRSSKEDYKDMLKDENSIAIVAFSDSEYVGNIVGSPLLDHEFDEYELDKKKKIVYLYNIVVENNYQGRGLGSKLLKEFIKVAKERGFDTLVGHFRQNRSLALIKKLGCIIKKVHNNWEDSGEDYCFCELDLKNINF